MRKTDAVGIAPEKELSLIVKQGVARYLALRGRRQALLNADARTQYMHSEQRARRSGADLNRIDRVGIATGASP